MPKYTIAINYERQYDITYNIEKKLKIISYSVHEMNMNHRQV